MSKVFELIQQNPEEHTTNYSAFLAFLYLPTSNIGKAKKIFPEIKNVYNFGKMSQKPSKIIRAEDNKILREG